MHSSLFRSLIFILLFFGSSSTSAEIITLQNGDTLHAVVKKKTDTQVYIEHENLGAFAIIREDIASINYEEKALPGKQVSSTPFVDKGLFYSGFFRNWKRSLEVGLNGAAGVSDNSKFRSALELRYEDYKKRWHFSMFYLLTEENKETEENRLTANLIRDWLLPNTKWFYFSKFGYDWDRFKDWDYRTRTSSGPGYEFVNNEKLKILSRFGPSIYHTVGRDSNTTVIEADFGVEMMWKIRDKHTLGLTNDFYPSISDKGNYRNVTTLDWKIDLNYYRDLGVKFGVYNELDSTEMERYDLKYNISLVLGL
ncbi:MAG: DUF481 domain-containing protein [Candidatus Scalindua sp.]|nr:DUF481 domain-containing protein [Candidatus Scalindua sp.]